jgi:hypothetical protein
MHLSQDRVRKRPRTQGKAGPMREGNAAGPRKRHLVKGLHRLLANVWG